MSQLVLSLFPGIGLLDRAFEEEGFCVVRGPDLLWGGDIRNFHVPSGRFDGVIGGPPCQMFSILKNLNPKCGEKHGNLIPEFVRVVSEARPLWFVMENVKAAPIPTVEGYPVTTRLLRDMWVGGHTARERRISFGGLASRSPHYLEVLPLHTSDPEPAVLASASVRTPVKLGGSGKVKTTWQPRPGHRENGSSGLSTAIKHQGLPPDFDIPGFTVSAKLHAIGNGVPRAMGLAIARAVKAALVHCEVYEEIVKTVSERT